MPGNVSFPPIADIRRIGSKGLMDQPFSAPSTRQELSVRLAEALTSDDDLEALVAFLRDDLAYDPDNRSIIGPVLREDEFDAWQDLMNGVHWNAGWPIDYDPNEVRELSRKLFTEMQQT
jgi:hypothetical protein